MVMGNPCFAKDHSTIGWDLSIAGLGKHGKIGDFRDLSMGKIGGLSMFNGI